jgi:hypothetical protein
MQQRIVGMNVGAMNRKVVKGLMNKQPEEVAQQGCENINGKCAKDKLIS